MPSGNLIGGAAAAGPVKDVTTATFKAEVIDGSFDAPVIVDFWAPWCGPCRQLGPILERVVRAANGAVRLVKINIDENREIAQQMRIQSIPAVYAFADGRPVDGFVGALPEGQVKQFVQRLTSARGGGPSPIEEALAMAKQSLADGDHRSAAGLYSQILQHDRDNLEASAGLARALIAQGSLAKARQALDRVPKDAEHAEIAAARTALELAEAAHKAMGQAGKLRARIAQNPDDHAARLDLATALFGNSQREAAIDELLTSFKRDRAWNDGAARKQLLKFFEAMGPADPLTLSARRRLSSLMFS